jgi:hypothetical protein
MNNQDSHRRCGTKGEQVSRNFGRACRSPMGDRLLPGSASTASWPGSPNRRLLLMIVTDKGIEMTSDASLVSPAERGGTGTTSHLAR